MICLIFCVKKNYISYRTYNRETLGSTKKKVSTQRYSNLTLQDFFYNISHFWFVWTIVRRRDDFWFAKSLENDGHTP